MQNIYAIVLYGLYYVESSPDSLHSWCTRHMAGVPGQPILERNIFGTTAALDK